MVTKFTLRTVPIGQVCTSDKALCHVLNRVQVWGGIRFYSGKNVAAIVNATHHFTSNLPDPKAAIIVNIEYIIAKVTY